VDTLSISELYNRNLGEFISILWKKIWYPLWNLFIVNFQNVSRTYEKPCIK
jgi:hypothetical protein